MHRSQVFNVFGQNEYHKGDMMSVVAKNYRTAAEGGEIKLFKNYRKEFADGGQLRDFIYVNDVVDVILWCLEVSASVRPLQCRNWPSYIFPGIDRSTLRRRPSGAYALVCADA